MITVHIHSYNLLERQIIIVDDIHFDKVVLWLQYLKQYNGYYLYNDSYSV